MTEKARHSLILHCGFSLAVFALFLPAPLLGEVFEVFYNSEEELVKQWLLFSSEAGMDIIPAEREKGEGGYMIKVFGDEARRGSLLAGVVKTAKGEILSTPLTSSVGNELEAESIKLAREKIPALKAEIQKGGAELQRLKGEMNLLNITKRKEYGFEEIDKTYELIDKMEEEMAQIRKAKGADKPGEEITKQSG